VVSREESLLIVSSPIAVLDHSRLPDPINEALKFIVAQQNEIKHRLDRLENQPSLRNPGARHGFAYKGSTNDTIIG